jgi:hypothetical protein
MNTPHIHIAALYTHTHFKHLFLVQRVANGWVYTTDLTLCEDKSIPVAVFNQWYILYEGAHD